MLFVLVVCSVFNLVSWRFFGRVSLGRDDTNYAKGCVNVCCLWKVEENTEKREEEEKVHNYFNCFGEAFGQGVKGGMRDRKHFATLLALIELNARDRCKQCPQLLFIVLYCYCRAELSNCPIDQRSVPQNGAVKGTLVRVGNGL